ncbi:MAG: D-tyrosyl-tRNA(Tyr) deacylase [candidate division TM6 bacterium GW2011_GWF2_32_72]|nr:MAG: D-tyrosyl-tRNA(Tyr) deacylase [candidate division TM6 bacterium GW2011_GWF2_32_72]
MKVVIQRVAHASVSVNNEVFSKIGKGLLVLVGLDHEDSEAKFDFFIKKILNLRIFADETGKMNRSVQDVGGEVLLVSQFTLYGDCANGNRPSFTGAMAPDKAKALYSQFVSKFSAEYQKTYDGIFGAYMQIELQNDGPVTFIIEK